MPELLGTSAIRIRSAETPNLSLKQGVDLQKEGQKFIAKVTFDWFNAIIRSLRITKQELRKSLKPPSRVPYLVEFCIEHCGSLYRIVRCQDDLEGEEIKVDFVHEVGHLSDWETFKQVCDCKDIDEAKSERLRFDLTYTKENILNRLLYTPRISRLVYSLGSFSGSSAKMHLGEWGKILGTNWDDAIEQYLNNGIKHGRARIRDLEIDMKFLRQIVKIIKRYLPPLGGNEEYKMQYQALRRDIWGYSKEDQEDRAKRKPTVYERLRVVWRAENVKQKAHLLRTLIVTSFNAAYRNIFLAATCLCLELGVCQNTQSRHPAEMFIDISTERKFLQLAKDLGFSLMEKQYASVVKANIDIKDGVKHNWTRGRPPDRFTSHQWKLFLISGQISPASEALVRLMDDFFEDAPIFKPPTLVSPTPNRSQGFSEFIPYHSKTYKFSSFTSPSQSSTHGGSPSGSSTNMIFSGSLKSQDSPYGLSGQQKITKRQERQEKHRSQEPDSRLQKFLLQAENILPTARNTAPGAAPEETGSQNQNGLLATSTEITTPQPTPIIRETAKQRKQRIEKEEKAMRIARGALKDPLKIPPIREMKPSRDVSTQPMQIEYIRQPKSKRVRFDTKEFGIEENQETPRFAQRSVTSAEEFSLSSPNFSIADFNESDAAHAKRRHDGTMKLVPRKRSLRKEKQPKGKALDTSDSDMQKPRTLHKPRTSIPSRVKHGVEKIVNSQLRQKEPDRLEEEEDDGIL